MTADDGQNDAHPLIRRMERDGALASMPDDERAWIEVVRKMDEVYAELVESQVELERKNAELERAQKFISRVLSSISDLLIVCDDDGRIRTVNDALTRLTGIPTRDMIGRPLENVLKGRDIRETFARMARGAEADPVSHCPVSITGADGEDIPLSVSCARLHDSRGSGTGMVLVGRPEGELERAYRKLDRAYRDLRRAQKQLILSEKMAALGRLVAGVAHELNNPVSFVFGNMHAMRRYGGNLLAYIRALEEGAQGRETAELREELGIGPIMEDLMSLIDGTLEGAERISEIVQELRRFGSAQKEPVERFPLAPVLRTAVDWVLRGARRRPEVELTCPPELVVTARRGHVHQIVVNLVQNALDVLENAEAPRVLVRAEHADGRILILVRDNGPGIAPEHMDGIFEPFYTTKPLGKGTGLGLYVSYTLAEELGGSLGARNHEDGGAEFCLTLPPDAAREGS